MLGTGTNKRARGLFDSKGMLIVQINLNPSYTNPCTHKEQDCGNVLLCFKYRRSLTIRRLFPTEEGGGGVTEVCSGKQFNMKAKVVTKAVMKTRHSYDYWDVS